jgi:hypothetical protein
MLVQYRCLVYTKGTIGSKNHFGHTQWNSLVMLVMWNLVSVYFRTVFSIGVRWAHGLSQTCHGFTNCFGCT